MLLVKKNIIQTFDKTEHISTALVDLSLIHTYARPPLSVDFLDCHNIFVNNLYS
jgi:hypothetical protein